MDAPNTSEVYDLSVRFFHSTTVQEQKELLKSSFLRVYSWFSLLGISRHASNTFS